MKGSQLIGLVLLVLGILALVYGGFTYTEESHDVDLGPVEFQVQEEKKVNVPLWLGVAATAFGAVLLLVRGRSK